MRLLIVTWRSRLGQKRTAPLPGVRRDLDTNGVLVQISQGLASSNGRLIAQKGRDDVLSFCFPFVAK